MMATMIAAIMMLAPGPVVRWSSPVPIDASEIAYSDQGVVARPDGEVLPIVIPWYDVRSIPGGWTGEAAEFQNVAETARLAHQRRLRGDIHGAGELYLRLNEQLGGTRGEQAFDIAIGLLERGLLSGSPSEAVIPWLMVLQAAGTGRQYNGPLLDARTGLHPAVVPVFLHPGRGASIPPEEFPVREQLLYEYYSLAMSADRSEEGDALLAELEGRARKLGDRDTGVLFVHEIVAATRASDPTTRLAAREQLSRTARSSDEGWMMDWAKLAVGASLLAEASEDQQELGAVECIGVVVDPQSGTPDSVRMLAAELVAGYLRETGRDQYAETVLMTAMIQTEPETGVAP